MAKHSENKNGMHRNKKLIQSLLAMFIFFIIGDQVFRLIGKMFLSSPWAASVDIAIAEDIFWINGLIPDVVFLGDSRFGEGLKPVTVEQVLTDQGMHLATVNIWMASAGPGDYRKIVRNIMGSYKPRLIICNINENALNMKASEENRASRIRIWHEIPDRLKSCQDTWEWHTHKLFAAKHYGGIIEQAFYNMISDLGRVILLGNERSEGNLGKSKGYFKNRSRQRPANLAIREEIDTRVYSTIKVTDEGALKFKSFLSSVRQNDLRLVMIMAPVAPELAAKYSPERYKAFIRFIKDTTASHEIPFVNYYQDSILPSDAFFDHHHLNDKGAEIFSRQIADEVVAPALRDWQGFKDALKAKKDRITE